MKNNQNVIKIFCGAYGLNFLGTGIINSIFILMLSEVKGYSINQIAIITSITPIIIIPVIFIWGKLIDKYKKLIFWAQIIAFSQGVLACVLLFVGQFETFFVINIIRIMLTQPSGTVHDEYIFNLSKNYQVPFGKLRLFGTIGFGISGLIAPIIVNKFSILSAMGVGIAIVFLNILNYRWLPDTIIQKKKKKEDKPNKLVNNKIDFSLLKNKQYVKFIIISSLLFGTLTAASGFSTQIILIKLHCPSEIIASLPMLMIIFEALLLGIIDRFRISKKPYILFLIALIVISLRWAVLAQATHYMTVVITTIVHGIICGITLGSQTKIVGELVEEKDRSSALLIQGTIAFTLTPSILNLMTSYLLPKMGIGVFGYTYLILSAIGIIITLPDIIRKKITNPRAA